MENEEIIEELIEEEVEEEVTEEVAVEDNLDDNSVGLFSTENISSDYDLQILEELQKSNQNWDLFLDSYSVTDTGISQVFTRTGCPSFRVGTGLYNATNGRTISFPVSKGVTYSLNGVSINAGTYEHVTYFSSDSFITVDSVVYDITSWNNDILSSMVFTSPYDGYFYIQWTGGGLTSVSLQSVTWSWTHYDSYTLSEIGNSLVSLDFKINGLNTIITIETSLLLVTLFTFFLSAIRKFGKKANRKGDL